MIKTLSAGQEVNNEDRTERYTITDIIGRGASTVAYLAELDNGCYCSKRILKEYCPSYVLIDRTEEGKIIVSDKERERFENGKKRFLDGGKRQNILRERTNLRNQTPLIVTNFEANNTVYLDVTPYEGIIFENANELSLLDRLKVCLATAKLVALYHKEGYLCLDIKPSNIFVLNETVDIVEFVDFDSVREKKDISFGNSLSYTKSWAAPEQKNPYSVDKICEATDVFAVGEMVFWVVFGRHSCNKEHRSNSKYIFEDSRYDELKRNRVCDLLKKLFAGTIRSSVNNRFDTMEPVILLLEKIIEEVSRKESIIDVDVFSKDYFIGRDAELKMLDKSLQEHKVVFVTGIPGIGKSEIVKRYVCIHKSEFDHVLYWFYEGNFERMICSDYYVSISNFRQEQGETDEEYSHRKLKKLCSLVTNRTLIIIDNLDVLVEEIGYQALWNKLKSFPGKIIITTRCEQKNYETIYIAEIKGTEYLIDIFNSHCPSSVDVEGEDESVRKIVQITNRHTYEIELLAAYAEAEKILPSELLNRMEIYGIGGFDKSKFHSIKDGQDNSLTFLDHLQKIFSLNNLSDAQKKLLLKVSFAPNGGVKASQFKKFYSIEDYNDLNWLIGHGLVYETVDSRHIITIHPAIAEKTVEIIRKEKDIIDVFYEEAITAMRKGHEDKSINEEFLRSLHLFVNELLGEKKDVKDKDLGNLSKEELKYRIEKASDEFVRQYARIDIEKEVYTSLCETLVHKSLSFQMSGELAARYMGQYVQWFMRYGHHEFLRRVLLYVTKIYENINSAFYLQDRECVYDMYVLLLLKDKKEGRDAIKLSTEHLEKAVSAKDWKYASNWCSNMVKAYYDLNDYWAVFRYQIKGFWYAMKSVWFRKGNTYSNEFFPDEYSKNQRELEREYEEWVEIPKMAIFALRTAIYSRKAKNNYSDTDLSANGIKILINKAKIKMLQNDFYGAKEEMKSFVTTYRNGDLICTEVSYEAFCLLAEICTILSQYDEALDNYQECLKIAEKLEYKDAYSIYAKIGRVYNLRGEVELSAKTNLRLIQKLEELNIEAFQIVLADVYFNVAELYGLMNQSDESMGYVAKAESLYDRYEQYRTHCKISKSRCNILKAKNLIKNNCQEEGEKLFKEGIEKLENILGKSHPEIVKLKQ